MKDWHPAIPAGRRVYAIGDIHGRLDLLQHLLAMIEADIGDTAPSSKLVFLGDYIDRGPDAKGVVERLMQPLPGDGEPVFLLGNHEQVLLSLFEDTKDGPAWLIHGGQQTLLSYGISCPPGNPTPERLLVLQENLRERFPAAHRAFFANLPLSWSSGDYFFAHAGARPGRPLDKQTPEDLLWIRRGFLDCPDRLEKMVVHGHTISPAIEERSNRIGIDTGAYVSGILTALVLEATSRRVLQTAKHQNIITDTT